MFNLAVFGMLAQIAITLGIFNVWLIRFNKPTAYRGGGAVNMREEFAAYGLSASAMYVVGGLKLALAALLLVGLAYEPVVQPAALGMAVLMIGAVLMHLKVGDPLVRALPAATMLALSVVAASL